MKIHTKVVFDMNTLQCIEDDFFEYSGGVEQCKGGGSYPEATQEEKDIYKNQADIAKSAREETEQLRPILFKQMGFNLADGKLSKMSTEEKNRYMTPEEKETYSINKILMDRIQGAYGGKDTLLPAFKADLDAWKQSLPAGATTGSKTAEAQALDDFGKRSAVVSDLSREGEIKSVSDNLINGLNLAQSLNQQRVDQMRQLPNRNMGMIQDYQAILNPMQSYRGMQAGVNQQNAANRSSQTAGYASAAGTVIAVVAAII